MGETQDTEECMPSTAKRRNSFHGIPTLRGHPMRPVRSTVHLASPLTLPAVGPNCLSNHTMLSEPTASSSSRAPVSPIQRRSAPLVGNPQSASPGRQVGSLHSMPLLAMCSSYQSVANDFALPKARAEAEEHWGSVGSMETGDVESVEDYVRNLDNGPEAMVLSPMGSSWIKATKKVLFENSFTIWFDGLAVRGKKQTNAKQYENALHEVGSFSSVQEFWRFWNAMDLVGMAKNSSLSVFKNPIKPMWEDKGNTEGARYILKICNERQAAENFTDVVLSLVGATFDCHDHLCGAVLSSKGTFYTMQIWTKSFTDDLFSKLEVELKMLLGDDYPAKDIGWKAHNGASQKPGKNAKQNAALQSVTSQYPYQQWGMYGQSYAQAYQQYYFWQAGGA